MWMTLYFQPHISLNLSSVFSTACRSSPFMTYCNFRVSRAHIGLIIHSPYPSFLPPHPPKFMQLSFQRSPLAGYEDEPLLGHWNFIWGNSSHVALYNLKKYEWRTFKILNNNLWLRYSNLCFFGFLNSQSENIVHLLFLIVLIHFHLFYQWGRFPISFPLSCFLFHISWFFFSFLLASPRHSGIIFFLHSLCLLSYNFL